MTKVTSDEDFAEEVVLFDKYEYPLDWATIIVLLAAGHGLVCGIRALPDEWQRRTWIGRGGLLILLSAWSLVVAAWAVLAVVVAIVNIPRAMLHIVSQEYQERVYRDEMNDI